MAGSLFNEVPQFYSDLYHSAYATTMRDSVWLYPSLQSLHLVGIGIMVGAVAMTDLRLIGLSRRMSVQDSARLMLPWAWAGFALIFLTGVNMFIGEAEVFYVNIVFRIKLLLIAAAGLNMGLFHWRVYKGVAAWDSDKPTPAGAKFAAALSIVIWLSTISAGKLLAYIGGKD